MKSRERARSQRHRGGSRASDSPSPAPRRTLSYDAPPFYMTAPDLSTGTADQALMADAAAQNGATTAGEIWGGGRRGRPCSMFSCCQASCLLIQDQSL